MIYFRLLIGGIVLLALIYYLCVILQCFNIIRFTQHNISFIKGIIPFYYFIKN